MTIRAALFCLLSIVFTSSLQAKIIGDFNGDGNVNLVDVIALLNHISGRGQIESVGEEYVISTPDLNDIPELTLGLDLPNEDPFVIYNDDDQDSFNAGILQIINQACRDALKQKEEEYETVMDGSYSGTAMVIGSWTVYEDNPFRNFDLILENFSNDGETFISGAFRISFPSWFHTFTHDGVVVYSFAPSINGIDDISLIGNCRVAGQIGSHVWYDCTIYKGSVETTYSASGRFCTFNRRVDSSSHGFSTNLQVTFDGDPVDWEDVDNNADVVVDSSSGDVNRVIMVQREPR